MRLELWYTICNPLHQLNYVQTPRCVDEERYTSTRSSRHGSCDGDEPVIRSYPVREERLDRASQPYV
jgi:hypothetical protein